MDWYFVLPIASVIGLVYGFSVAFRTDEAVRRGRGNSIDVAEFFFIAIERTLLLGGLVFAILSA